MLFCVLFTSFTYSRQPVCSCNRLNLCRIFMRRFTVLDVFITLKCAINSSLVRLVQLQSLLEFNLFS